MSGSLAEHVKDGIRATIYGNCIGDAIGLLTEFMPAYEARSMYENCRGSMHYGLKNDDRHRRNWQVGDWTDDSDQMILIMRSLCEHKKVDPVDYGGKLINWARHGFKELGDNGGCGLGATTHHVLKHPMYATDPHHAAQDIWERTGRQVAPNGAVMRTSVLGAYMFHDINAVIQNTLNICKVTHADTRCQASCVAVTTAIAQMLQQKRDHGDGVKHDVDAITQKSFKYASDCLDPEHRALRDDLEFHMKVKNLQDLQLDESGKIGYTYKCLGAGFWAFRQDDFRKALEELVLSGGDADTNGAVAGALLGCRLGLPGLPQQWLDGLLHKTWLDRVIAGFLQLIEQTPPTPSSPSAGTSDPMTQQQSQAASEENQQTEAAANQSESAANPANEKREQVRKGSETQESSDVWKKDENKTENVGSHKAGATGGSTKRQESRV